MKISSMQRTAFAARGILVLGVAVAAVLLAPYLDFIPVWDGLAYAECAVDVATNRFDLYFLRCYGHRAYAYSGILGLAQLIDVGNPVLRFVLNALVLAAAMLGFRRLMRRPFPGDGHETDIALLTVAFLLQPPFLASVIQPSLDLPVLAGAVWCAALFVERRWFWCGVVGTAMAFSKETGVLLYVVLLGCCLVWLVARTPGALTTRLRALKPLVPTAAPLVAYLGYVVAFRIIRPGQAPVWDTGSGRPIAAELMTFRLDAGFASYLALLFVLNFAWLPSISIAVDAAVGALRFTRPRPPRVLAGADRAVVGFLMLATVATIIALTRFITYSNVRYLMAGTALLLGVSYAALVRLRLPPGVRRIALAAYAALLVASATRTVDPVSRWVWGTFPFGTHQMLDMTSISGECCGAGRDQLVYSLEFARFGELTDSALTALMRDTATVIVFPSRMRYNLLGRVDVRTWRRTLRRDSTAFQTVVEAGPVVLIAKEPPQSVLYLDMPNAQDPATLALLGNLYTVEAKGQFESAGYAMSAYRLTGKRREPAP